LEDRDMPETRQSRSVRIVAQGDRLNAAARAEIGDLNQSRLIVHRVMARALVDASVSSTDEAMDQSLRRALRDYAGRSH
jgi:hypothetical protein